MPNLLKELEIVEGVTSYLITLYDESAHTKIGTLSELTTTDKSSIVNAINEIVSNVVRVEGKANTNADNLAQEILDRINGDNTLSGKIGNLDNLNTTIKTNLVSAINEVLDNAGIYNNSTPNSGLTTNIGLKEGTYNITENTTINAQLIVPKGAIINVASGVTLTLNSDILAGRYQIFSGSGTVTGKGKSYPEWFGGLPNDNQIDCSSAINKCIDNFDYCLLDVGNYYVANTIEITKHGAILKGVSRGGITVNKGSVITDQRLTASNTIYVKGTSLQSLVTGVQIQNICIDRISGAFTSPTRGLLCKYTLDCWFKDMIVKQNSVCYHIEDNTDIHFVNCDAIQYFTGVDRYGFLVDDAISQESGGNASLYMINCHCTGTTDSEHVNAGFGCASYPADTFIDGFETAGYDSGIIIYDYTHTANTSCDIHISRAVLDGITGHGIYFNHLSDFGSAIVENCYVAVASSGSPTSYRVEDCTCPITFIGNQAVHNIGSNTSIAFMFGHCSNVATKNNEITGCYRPYVLLGASGIVLEDILKHTNPSVNPVVDVGEGANDIKVAMLLFSGSGVYPYLYKALNNTDKVRVDIGAVKRTCLATGYIYDGTSASDVTSGSIEIL